MERRAVVVTTLRVRPLVAVSLPPPLRNPAVAAVAALPTSPAVVRSSRNVCSARRRRALGRRCVKVCELDAMVIIRRWSQGCGRRGEGTTSRRSTEFRVAPAARRRGVPSKLLVLHRIAVSLVLVTRASIIRRGESLERERCCQVENNHTSTYGSNTITQRPCS